MLAFNVSRSEKTLSSVILPSSLLMVVCASCVTAYSAFSTPYDARYGSTTCDAWSERDQRQQGASRDCWRDPCACAATGAAARACLDIQHAIDRERHIVLGDGSLVGHWDCRLLQRVRVRNAVHLKVQGSVQTRATRPTAACPSRQRPCLAPCEPSPQARAPQAHHRDQEVQPGGKGATVLAKALHHVGCTKGGQAQRCARGQGGHRAAAHEHATHHRTRLLRHDADDGVGGCGARRK